MNPSRIAVQLTLTEEQDKLVKLAVLAGIAKSKASYCLKALENSLESMQINDLIHKAEILGNKEKLKELGFR